MGDYAPRLSIPTDFAALDEALYAPGSPSHAMLGQRLAERDRFLLANLRRRWSEAWPQNQTGDALLSGNDLPLLTGGRRVAALEWTPTPLVERGEWYVHANLTLGSKVRAVPWMLPGRAPRGWTEDDVELVGTGSSAKYGPIPMSFGGQADPAWIGLDTFADISSTSPVDEAVAACHPFNLQSVAGSFAALVRPYAYYIRIYGREDAFGVRSFEGGWCLIVSVYTTAIANDSVWVLGALTANHYGPDDGIRFELRSEVSGRIEAVSFFELPLTGRLR